MMKRRRVGGNWEGGVWSAEVGKGRKVNSRSSGMDSSSASLFEPHQYSAGIERRPSLPIFRNKFGSTLQFPFVSVEN